ncbi:DUF3558 family protein [Amycolatopsis jiangsuensis]|uniref:DUF3558 domain-containing protein n=1 Tax=Amycolatopsis jiangsuensis TaxID=1181879 RepID=A0A840IZB9_9PSEU|nr:DUF3558 family protein [Amycolatopsis jiangsuensis]MBB4687033.1 hypothetical protein [Amycolatopsis jiangsuensis]
MGFNRVRLAAVVAGVVLLLAGCTERVRGVAASVPGQGPVAQAVDACSLLDAQQLAGLGYEGGGRSVKASKEQRAPAMCLWNRDDEGGELIVMSVGRSVDLSLDDYLQGALQKDSPAQLGGLSWTRYASLIEGSCDLYTTLGRKSFAFVSVSYPDDAKACELAKTTAPQVASHLPGGQPAPSLTPPSASSSAPPSGPLASLDPCTLLKPEQAQQLAVEPQGAKDQSTAVPGATYCLWKDNDGDRGQKPFEVWLGPSQPMTSWPGMDVSPVQQIDAGGRKWSLFANFNDSDGVNCAAGLAVSDTSSIQLVSGNLDDPNKSCDAIKAGIPFVSGNLPG